MKIKPIIEGWTNTIITNDATEKIATERMATCNLCPEKKIMLAVEICGVCHCPLIAKTRATENTCPLKKWNQ